MKSRDIEMVKNIKKWAAPYYDFWYFVSVRAMWAFVLYFFAIWWVYGFAFEVLLKMIAVVPLTFVVTFFIRRIVRRPRPKVEAVYKPFLNDFSFPSIHASTSFAFAGGLILLSIPVLAPVALVICSAFLFSLAVLIAFSRMAVGVHYASDLFAGAALGLLIATLFI